MDKSFDESMQVIEICASKRWELYRERLDEQANSLSDNLNLGKLESQDLLCKVFGLSSWDYLQESINMLESAENIFLEDKRDYERLLIRIINLQGERHCETRLTKGYDFNDIFEEQIDVLKTALNDYKTDCVDSSSELGTCEKIENYITVYLPFMTFKTTTWNTPLSETWLTLSGAYYVNLRYSLDSKLNDACFFEEEAFRVYACLFGPEPDLEAANFFKEKIFNFKDVYSGNFGIHETDLMPDGEAYPPLATLSVAEIRNKLRYCSPNHVEDIALAVSLLDEEDILEISFKRPPRCGYISIDIICIYVKTEVNAARLSTFDGSIVTTLSEESLRGKQYFKLGQDS